MPDYNARLYRIVHTNQLRSHYLRPFGERERESFLRALVFLFIVETVLHPTALL